ncbi:MAG: hypothetical protein LBQ68_01410 [Clostridiales bacterium]|jgi:hypothetical protein|nr:hypothetical protein [Clostridiales bacterium]
MSFLLSHWHCVLPIAAIGVAMIFMRGKPMKKDERNGKKSKALPNQ